MRLLTSVQWLIRYQQCTRFVFSWARWTIQCCRFKNDIFGAETIPDTFFSPIFSFFPIVFFFYFSGHSKSRKKSEKLLNIFKKRRNPRFRGEFSCLFFFVEMSAFELEMSCSHPGRHKCFLVSSWQSFSTFKESPAGSGQLGISACWQHQYYLL